MRKTLILSGALSLVAAAVPAQTVRWNDRPTATTWQDQAPRVKVFIDGPRAVAYGAPVGIRFEVSDNAYVTVVRVDDDGRMTILFPYSRNQRAAARGGQLHYVRTPRLGNNVAFVATDRMSGYVFALASYAPLDFSLFENRDYNNLGGWSRFTTENRSIARRPDVFIDRFAAAVLWDKNTPYDYDVDYYHPFGYPGTFNTFAMCRSLGFNPIGWRTYRAQFSSFDRLAYPWAFDSMCSDVYYNLRCFSSFAWSGYYACGRRQMVYQGPTTNPTGGQPTNPTTFVPNEGVVKGGLQAPTPVPVIPGFADPAPPVERPNGRFDQVKGDDLDNISSIPERATRKMKEDDARRASGGAMPSRDRFDGASAGKPESRTASADAPARVQPPSRETTKSKATGEPRRATGRDRFGSTRGTSEPRSTGGPDRVSRPVEPKSTAGSSGSSGSFSGTSGDKKKPPQN